MADWYVSSAAWAAVPQFAVSTAYSVGNIVRPLAAPAFNAQYAFRCTVAGTSAAAEPAWPANNNATVVSGGATFANVTGQSAYGWGAAAGNLFCITNSGAGTGRIAVNDRVFLSSDHAEASVNSITPVPTASSGVAQIISVNRGGSVPPVAADALSGASIAYTGAGTFALDANCSLYWQGITLSLGGTGTFVWFNSTGQREHYFRNCAFVFTTSNTTAGLTGNNPGKVVFDNTTVQFNNAGQRIVMGLCSELVWLNTPAAILGTVPTVLFPVTTNQPLVVTCRGVDLSAVTTTLCSTLGTTGAAGAMKGLFDSCRIAPAVTRLGGAFALTADEMELVNCFDGTGFLSERHTPAGDVTTEFTITLSGGAQDNVGTFSHKLVSSVRCDKYAMTLDGFWMDANLATVGSAMTASVEIVGSASLNTDDITLLLEYEGTTGSSLASFVSSRSNALAAVAALPASAAIWNSSPATPAKQLLSVTFTPQMPGRVRGQVRLGKPSTTVYVNPVITIT